MDKEVKVSISCTAYNHGKYLDQAIESFLKQKTNFKFEILLHDDASTDNSSEIINEYYKKYPNIIRPLIQVENKYSQGIKVEDINLQRARGKYIAVCEGDDYWYDENKLQKQYDYMEVNQECSGTFTNAYYLDETKKKLNIVHKVKEGKYYAKDVIENGGEFIPTASIFYRKEIMENPPKFYFDAKVSDYPLQMIVASNGYVYCFEDFMTVYRMNNPESWTGRTFKNVFNRETNFKYNNDVIEMMQGFDKYTNGKFHQSVEKVILEHEFNILIFDKDISIEKVEKSKYANVYKHKLLGKSKQEQIGIKLQVTSTKKYITYCKFKAIAKKILRK